MTIENMSEEFIEWLDNCPVQWFLDSQDETSLSYTFMKDETN